MPRTQRRRAALFLHGNKNTERALPAGHRLPALAPPTGHYNTSADRIIT